MGGEETGVSETTTNILLESAYFLPASVRRTARNLNLPTDASYRFERGVDPATVLRASDRAAELIREIANGTPVKQTATAGKLPSNPTDIALSYNKSDQLLGIAINPKDVDDILNRFGLSKTKIQHKTKSGASTWKIPSYRRDLQRDVDLVEEIVRAYGVEKIPGAGRSRFTRTSPADQSHDIESKLRERLAARGLYEARTSKLIPRAEAAASAAVELRNPLTEDHVALRPDLMMGLLAVLDRNVRAGAEQVCVFEIGRVFVPPRAKEERHLGILLWGSAARAHWRLGEKRSLDFFDLKGAIGSLGIRGIEFRRIKRADLTLATELVSANKVLGFAGQLRSGRADVPGAILIAEIDVDRALTGPGDTKIFRELEKFPAVTRDIAMIVPEKISNAEILRTIENPKEGLLESVELFDLFSGDAAGLGEGKKSLAYRLTYRDQSRTLTSEEVNAAHAKIRERLRSDLGAELRE